MTDVRTEVRSALSVKIPSSTTASPPLSQTPPPVSQTAAPPTTSSPPCCEGGRPLVTDPHTGQTVCSCRLTNPLLAGAYRVPGLPESMYSTAAYAAQAAGYPAFSPTDPSTFYSPLNSAYSLKDSMEAWSRAAIPATAGVYPYDMAAYPYGYAGMDLNGARRKNATRESTSTLKAWLQEHIKNPYPTKGEKIMLAIITKMTLTQVSTWFANARRRLKKENKMTWSPKNRCDDDDDDDDMKEGSDGEEKERAEERRSEDEEDEHIDLTSTNFEDRLASPPSQPQKSQSSEKITKPKIWSLADTATSASPPSNRRSPPVNFSAHGSTTLVTCPTSMWSPAALYSTGAYTYSSPFHHHPHQRYGAPISVPGLSKIGEDMRNGMIGASRIPAFNGVTVSEAGFIHPAFSGAAFRPVEKALIPR